MSTSQIPRPAATSQPRRFPLTLRALATLIAVSVIAVIIALAQPGRPSGASGSHGTRAADADAIVRVQISPGQLRQEIRALEVVGYVPRACTVSGTLMIDPRTNRSATVAW